MQRTGNSEYTLSTGRRIYANHGLISIAEQDGEQGEPNAGRFEIGEGYDGGIDIGPSTYEGGVDGLTEAECGELARFMVHAWQKFGQLSATGALAFLYSFIEQHRSAIEQGESDLAISRGTREVTKPGDVYVTYEPTNQFTLKLTLNGGADDPLSPSHLRAMLRAAFRAGFNASSEGANGECFWPVLLRGGDWTDVETRAVERIMAGDVSDRRPDEGDNGNG